MATKLFNYEKTNRFAVVRKTSKSTRHRANFREMHPSAEAAVAEAMRLAQTTGGKFYVCEIFAISNGRAANDDTLTVPEGAE